MKSLKQAIHTSFGAKTLRVALVASVFAGSAHADEPVSALVQDRNEKGKLVQVYRPLKGLVPGGRFESAEFRIVKGNESEAIPLTATGSLKLKAATAYYHLNHALDHLQKNAVRNPFFASALKEMRFPITVRVEMSQPFSDVSHFVTDGSKLSNNSLTIPASGEMKADGVASWGDEIWFYVGEEKKIPSGAANVGAVLGTREFKNVLLQQMMFPELTEIGQEYAFGIQPFWQGHLASLATSIFVSEAFVPFLKVMTKPFKATQYVDTVMIPEVIYHEFGHILFKHRLGLFRPTAIVEGYPNYFAYQVSGLKNLMARNRDFVKGFAPKKGGSKQLYSLSAEYAQGAATGSFIYSLMVRLSQEFGAEADAILYGALVDLDRSSEIQIDFERAVLNAIYRHSKSPVARVIQAQKVFQEKGL